MNAFDPKLTNYTVRIRASKTIISVPKAENILFYNFLTRSAAVCSTDALYWVSCLQNWLDLEFIISTHPQIEVESLKCELQKLADLGILHYEYSANAQQEEKYLKDWEWGLAAGLFHFSILNNTFMHQSEGVKKQLQRAEHDPSPDLYWRNGTGSIPFESYHRSSISHVMGLMARRRTNRAAASPKISLCQLGDCLMAGMGITAHVSTPTGQLPLGMTPSGGARNPYEAFVFAQNVEGLSSGFYHYSAVENSLGLVTRDVPHRPSDFLAHQEWADEMPAIIFLVSILERTMWKYADPNSYRVVLIEAGHIGQNIMLAATAHGLSACPTAAMDHDLIAKCLGLEKITHAPVYALTLSEPGEYDSAIVNVA